MLDARIRPSDVPPEAEWDEQEALWIAARRGPDGQRSGPARGWSEQGVLAFECTYAGGRLEGAFKRLHADGSVFMQGTYEKGFLQGVVQKFVDANGSGEPLRGCCVPDGATRMDAHYSGGQVLDETFFDASGNALMSDGSLRPSHPEGIPADARYDEAIERFYKGSVDPRSLLSEGLWTYWRVDGSVSEESTFEGGKRVLVRRFDERGRWHESMELLRHDNWDEVRHGTYSRVLASEDVALVAGTDASPSTSALERAVVVDGQYDNGQICGIWLYRDAAGETVCRRDVGRALRPEVPGGSCDVQEAESRARICGCDASISASDALFAAGFVREALVVRARQCGADLRARGLGPSRLPAAHEAAAAQLEAFVAAHVLPRTPVDAAVVARSVLDAKTPTLSMLLDALVAGGDLAPLLRGLAKALKGDRELGLDLAEAAVALEPDQASSYLTRAALRLEAGLFEGAAADAKALKATDLRKRSSTGAPSAGQSGDLAEDLAAGQSSDHADDLAGVLPNHPSDERAGERVLEDARGDRADSGTAQAARNQPVQDAYDFLAHQLRVLQPAWRFAPAHHVLPELPEDIGVEPAQPLEQVQRIVGVYATRLSQLRAALQQLRPDNPPWVPPDLDALLPSGLVELESREAVIVDEDDEGQPEETLVTVAEAFEADFLQTGTALALMAAARAAWSGLTWLLWSVGQDSVSWPQAVVPRAEYPRALGLAMQRAWRAQDTLSTGGLRAVTQGIPGFEWEGLSIDEMPRVMVEIARDEYKEQRAVLLWLSNPGNISPYQDDLRQL